jgi:hypothetical protein
VVNTIPRPLYPGKDTVPIVLEAGWAPGLVWMCVKNLDPTGIRSPEHPACSQSLYRLSYPAHYWCWVCCCFFSILITCLIQLMTYHHQSYVLMTQIYFVLIKILMYLMMNWKQYSRKLKNGSKLIY